MLSPVNLTQDLTNQLCKNIAYRVDYLLKTCTNYRQGYFSGQMRMCFAHISPSNSLCIVNVNKEFKEEI